MWTHRRSGQNQPRSAQDHREPYERDFTRVIHCPAFRRLQRKTQILGTNTGDFHRTRLTHSLEVASIARSIVRNIASQSLHSPLTGLLPNDDLINTISLLHDIGHPPFGHGGEAALNFMMRAHGGFESNGQTLRLLTKLENSYGAYGLDLTRRTLLGILKYPVNQKHVCATHPPTATPPSPQQTIRINDWLPAKAYFDSEQPEVDWLLAPFHEQDRTRFQSLQTPATPLDHGKAAYHTLDCSIMNTADDIAYGVHDLEDAIHLQLINQDQFDNSELRHLLQQVGLANAEWTLLKQLFSHELYQRKQAIGELVNYLITATRCTITHEAFENNLFKHKVNLVPEAHELLHYLKQCIYQYVINSQSARTYEYGGQTLIIRLFEAINAHPFGLLDEQNRRTYREATTEQAAYRVITDYIANMTDESASKLNEALFGVR